MQKFKFDRTTFDDLKAYGLIIIINSLCDFMEAEIIKGNIIILEIRYSNQPAEIDQIIKTIEELQQFKNQL